MAPPPLPPEGSRLPSSTPPPLPFANDDMFVTGVPGAEGLTHRQLLDEISRGGRFVMFQYAISIVILTFRRRTDVQFFRAGQAVGARAWGPTIITLLTGWWGIPWGPIYSIQAIFLNLIGGEDVTGKLLAPLIGAERAESVLRHRPEQPAGVGLWSLRLMLIAIPVCVAGMISIAASTGAQRDQEMHKAPGYDAWRNAERHLSRADDGNNAAAKRLKALLDSALRLEAKDGTARKPKPFTVWCEFRERDTVVLVRWDDMRRVSENERETVHNVIWQAACLATRREPDPGEGSPLTVGLKGVIQWDSVMVGKVPPADRIDDAKPAHTIAGTEIKPRLIAAFATPALR